MTIILVRHAKAGSRQKWRGPDHLRPLSKKGWAQAHELADQLAGRTVTEVLSSPYVRCVQTVQPLAERLGLPVEETDVLAEGARAVDVLELVRKRAGENPILCTHGDVVPTLLDTLAAEDGLKLPDDYPCAKGSTWLLEPDPDGRFVTARYQPAP